jgi:phosphoribosylanthranilate isomerase
MTRIKICGITTLEDALEAVDAGADALGFVLASSPRLVRPDLAREIRRQLPPFVHVVGVFVNAPLERVRSVVEEVGIDTVQLPGEETPDYCARLGVAVLKRFPVGEEDTAESIQSRVDGYRVSGCLLDPGTGGGRTFRWEVGRGIGLPLIIAGGLNAANVAEAVRRVRPYAVDVSSGVEDAPGRKDPDRVRAFIEAVRGEDARHVAR